MIEHFCEIARRAERTGREAFLPRQIRWFIDLDVDGNVVGFTPATSRDEQGKEVKGKRFDCPAHYFMQIKEDGKGNRKVCGVNDNQSTWKPDFLLGTIEELFRGKVNEAREHNQKHRPTRELIEQARLAKPKNLTVRAISLFLHRRPKPRFKGLPHRNPTDDTWTYFSDNLSREIISFRVGGRIAIRDAELEEWWTKNQNGQRDDVCKLPPPGGLPDGSDVWSQNPDKLAVRFPYVFGNLKLASFNSAPFVSYGLGDQTAMLRLETAEMAAAGLNHLRNSNSTHVRLGETVTVFWASTPKAPTDFIQLLNDPDPLRVRDFLLNTFGGIETEIDTTRFYAVSFYIPTQGRFSVLSIQDQTLPHAKSSLRDFFQSVGMGEEHAEPIALKNLADATIPKSSRKQRPALETLTSLLNTALFGKHLPERILPQALERQRMELATGWVMKKRRPADIDRPEFELRLRARTALLTLYFQRNLEQTFTKENIMNLNDPIGNDPAVLCGRMLGVLDLIHNTAHDGRSASSPANRFYASASTTPALVFPRLCKLAQYHLAKYNNKGLARKHELGVPAAKRADGVNEDAPGLAQIADRILAVCKQYPRMLSLEEQGRFALGFYHERARKWPNYVKRNPDGSTVEVETEDDLTDESEAADPTGLI